MNNRVLITGVAGFVGSHTARKFLNEGWEVFGIDNFSKGYKENISDLMENTNFYFLEHDIKNKFENFDFELDCIFHFAAIGDIPYCFLHPEEAVNDNIIGTINVCDIAKRSKAMHIYFADTSAVYDSIYEEEKYPLMESYAPSAFSPNSIYAITKTAAANFLRSTCPIYGIGFTGFRYSNIYGPSMDLTREVPPVIGGFAKKLLDGERPIIYGDGSKIREFVYIQDLVDLHYKSIEYRMTMKNPTIFNVGSGNPVTIKEIYNIVWNICSEYKKDIPEYEDIDWHGPRINESEKVILNSGYVNTFCHWECNVSLEDGVRKTIESIINK